MNEAETRAEHIDPALKAAGWGVVDASVVRLEYPITLGRLEGSGRRGKALVADWDSASGPAENHKIRPHLSELQDVAVNRQLELHA